MDNATLSLRDTSKLYARARQYLQHEQDAHFRRDVADLIEQQNNQEIYERFYSVLDFGTGGVRALIAGGGNCINPYNIGKISQGLANYILQQGNSQPSVVIAHDNRNYSALFTMQAALVFAANNIRCYIFDSLRPTPQLSYTVRYLKASAGVMITASHNPPAYNGYKVYWNDGSQITAPHDQAIIDEINKISGAVRSLPEQQSREQGLLTILDSSYDDHFLDQVQSQILRPDLVRQWSSKLKVVYTPLHGAGRMMIEKTSQRMNIDLFTVPEQAEPDGNFPTVEFPNPEEASAMKLGLKWSRERQADLLMGSDPDGDRLGIAVPVAGDYTLISGNQLGALLLDYICCSYSETKKMPPRPAVVNTIVTTPLQKKIADSYQVACFQSLTGFKHIAALVRRFEEENSYSFLFGTEESYGYMVGTAVRDKDSVSAAAITIEMALWNLSQNRSIFAHLQQLYQRFGRHQEHTINIKFPGASGKQLMSEMMAKLRRESPSDIAGHKILCRRDYQLQQEFNLVNGQNQPIDLPISNVLQFVTDDESVITVRPSGTEPKMKIYICSCLAYSKDAEEQLANKVKRYEVALKELMSN